MPVVSIPPGRQRNRRADTDRNGHNVKRATQRRPADDFQSERRARGIDARHLWPGILGYWIGPESIFVNESL